MARMRGRLKSRTKTNKATPTTKRTKQVKKEAMVGSGKSKAADLAGLLSPIATVVDKVTLVPIFSSYCFEGGWVYGWDDTVGVRAKLDVGFQASVEHKPFAGIISSLGGKVALTCDQDILHMESGPSQWEFTAGSPEGFVVDWPDELPKSEGNFTLKWNPEMAQRFNALMTATDKEEVTPLLIGIHVIRDGGKVVLLTTDSSKYIEINLPKGSFDWTGDNDDHLIIPPDLVKVLLSLEEEGEIWIEENEGEDYWYGRVGAHEIMCRAYLHTYLDEDCPNLRAFTGEFSCKEAGHEISKEMKAGVERARLASSGTVGAWGIWMKMKTEDGNLSLDYGSSGHGHGHEMIPWKGVFDRKISVEVGLLDWLVQGSKRLYLEHIESKNMDALVGKGEDRMLAIATDEDIESDA